MTRDGIDTGQRTKNKPAMPPIGTHSEMALGNAVVGSPHSSAMEDIIPMAEKLLHVSVRLELGGAKISRVGCR
jgi:hypothetical protein